MISVNPRLVRDDKPVERATSPALPGELTALIVAIHGAEAVKAVEIPADYAEFVRTDGGGLWTLDRNGAPDPYGWEVHRFSTALAATTALYERAVTQQQDAADRRYEASIAAMRKAGCWLEIGGYGWRHLHYLCCDRSREQFGKVYDLNDGDPTTGMVPDVVWASFTEYIS